MKNILNFGSLNIDKVYAVEHMVRAGETLAAQKMEEFPGGKGLNQSVALSRAGGTVSHAGKIGADGAFLKALLEEAGVNTDFVYCSGGHTGQATIQVDANGQNCILLYHGTNYELTEADMDNALSHFQKGDLLVLQNEINDLPLLIDKAFAQGMEIALNPSPIGPELAHCKLEKVTWFLLNEIEGFELTGEREPEKITGQLLQRYPTAKIVLTLGKDGVFYRDAEQTCTHGTYRVPVVDTTAAGDTFTGFFLCRVAAGDSVSAALKIASVASSIAVSRNGAAVSIPTLAEVMQSALIEE